MTRKCCDNRCDQGRFCPLRHGMMAPPLTERDLDRNESHKAAIVQTLPDLLLSKGSMEGPFKRLHSPSPIRTAARRAYRALWVWINTTATLLRANRSNTK